MCVVERRLEENLETADLQLSRDSTWISSFDLYIAFYLEIAELEDAPERLVC